MWSDLQLSGSVRDSVLYNKMEAAGDTVTTVNLLPLAIYSTNFVLLKKWRIIEGDMKLLLHTCAYAYTDIHMHTHMNMHTKTNYPKDWDIGQRPHAY